MAGALKVTAPLVTAQVENGRVIYLYRDDIVPEGVSDESLENLQSLGYVAEVEDEGSTEPKTSSRSKK